MRAQHTLRILRSATLLALSALPAAQAQTTSGTATVRLNALANQRLAVAVTPGLLNFALPPSGGVANGSAVLLITTGWNLRAGTNNVTLWAYLTSTTAALTNGAGGNIPSARVRGSVNGGAFRPFLQNSPFGAGRSLQIFRLRIRNNNRIGRRNDTLNLQINTIGLGLPSGTYTGVLRIQARAI